MYEEGLLSPLRHPIFAKAGESGVNLLRMTSLKYALGKVAPETTTTQNSLAGGKIEQQQFVEQASGATTAVRAAYKVNGPGLTRDT